MRRGAALFIAFLYVATGAAWSGVTVTLHEFSDFPGWESDDHTEALRAFNASCGLVNDLEMEKLCAVSQSGPDARAFFESFFKPVRIENGEPPLFTGYYEPELFGSRTKTNRFRFPIYSKPPEVKEGRLWKTRAEIETRGVLSGRGLEIAYLDDPVDLMFLQIQGSGRIRLTDGSTLRLGYSASNGHPYRSIGQELVRRGILNQHQASAAVIKNWVKNNPQAGRQLLHHNTNYVFFREIQKLSPSKGPVGAMTVPLSELRSVAVDPKFIPLGSPVWVDKSGQFPLRRMAIVQDAGSKIKGAQRNDVFYGTGKDAGSLAAQIKDTGVVYVLLPVARALRLAHVGLER